MKQLNETIGFFKKTVTLVFAIGVLSFLGATSTSAQSNDNCPDCKDLIIKYDSINDILKSHVELLSNAQKELKKTTDSNGKVKELEKTAAIVDKLREELIPIKELREEARHALEVCFALGNPDVCKKCAKGIEVNDDGALCDDGDPCTKNDRCVNGICIGDPVTSTENPDCGGN